MRRREEPVSVLCSHCLRLFVHRPGDRPGCGSTFGDLRHPRRHRAFATKMSCKVKYNYL